MAFSNLRNSNLIYILYKDNTPRLEVGKVISISLLMPKYNNTGIYNPEMVIDITVDVNGQTTNFLKLPALGDIADFGNNIVLSCNKEAMSSEILSMKLHSLDIINSIELHKNIIKGCDDILFQLNPEIKEKLRLEEESKALREELNSLKDMFKEFLKLNTNGNNN